MEVAQPALALLDVGLDDVAAVADALVALVALGQLLGDELTLGPRDDFGLKAPCGVVVQRAVAPHIAAFEQRRADRQVGPGHAHHVVGRAGRMADFKAEVPQEIEDCLDRLLAPRGLLERGEEGDVDVRMRRHLAAAVAADRHDRQPLARGAVGDRVEMLGDVVVDQPDELIDQKCLFLGAIAPGRGALAQPASDFGAA